MKLPERLIVTYRLKGSHDHQTRRCMKVETEIDYTDNATAYLVFFEHDGPVQAGSRVRFDRIEMLHVSPILGAA